LAAVIAEADAANAVLIRNTARDIATRLGFEIPELQPPATNGMEPELTQAGERLVTMLFADVRGYTALSSTTAPADLAERIGTLHRWAAAEVGRHHGFVDKFAGDAVMATFNATGTRIDHAQEALAAALALSGKAALLDLGVGIGIAVGPSGEPSPAATSPSLARPRTSPHVCKPLQRRARSCSVRKRTGASRRGSKSEGSKPSRRRSSSRASTIRSPHSG
jgi:hypothetical protein